MPPYSNTSSPQSTQATYGSDATPCRSPSNDTPSDTAKDEYEKDMAAFFAYYQRSAYGMSFRGGMRASASPSPTAPVFTPSGSNKTARAEAMKKFHSECKLRKLRKEEKERRAKKQKLDADKARKTSTGEVETARQATLSSPSGVSVGSWTGDEKFIPNMKA